MIHCLLIKIAHSARGMPVRSYHTLAGDELQLGRGAECKVHLPDPRVAMHHAVIRRMDDGRLHLVALNGELEVGGALQPNVALEHGRQIMVGPYRLSVEPTPPDVDLVISVVLAHPLPDEYQNLKSRMQEPLPGAGRFKRRLSLLLAAAIALTCLALPLTQILLPQLRAAAAHWPMGFDQVWSPGRISTAHQHFGSQCMQCHRAPTKQVSDQACLQCHRDTAPHIADPALQQRAFKSGLISFGGRRCAECHREHKAPHPLARQDNAACVKCHGDIKAVDAATRLPDIHDFDRDHPGFKLSFRTGPTAEDIERIAQTDTARLVEKSGLKFAHVQHVGLVQGPGGMSDIRELSCTSCHRPTGQEMRFQPLSFKRDCMACHADRLEVGPGDATLRLPHGSERDVLNALKVQAPQQVARYAESLGKTGCAYCHAMQPGAAGDELPWRITPLAITQDWFSRARFNHASHRTQQCQSCHDVENSETSADVAMPDRQSCLACHAGNRPKFRRIASSCMSCHDFHRAHAPLAGGKLDAADVQRLMRLGQGAGQP